VVALSGPSAHVLSADDAGKEGPNAYAVDIDVMVRDNAAVAERRRADGMVGRALDFCCVWKKMSAIAVRTGEGKTLTE